MKAFLAFWPVLVVAAQVLLAALVIWVDARTASKVTGAVGPLKTDVDSLKSQVAAFETRLSQAEGDINNLPTKADLARLEGEVKAAHAEIRNVGSGVVRLEGYFLERGVKG